MKFKDADLVGFPYRVTIGPKGLANGVFELVRRADGEKRDLPIEHAAETIVEAVLRLAEEGEITVHGSRGHGERWPRWKKAARWSISSTATSTSFVRITPFHP